MPPKRKSITAAPYPGKNQGREVLDGMSKSSKKVVVTAGPFIDQSSTKVESTSASQPGTLCACREEATGWFYHECNNTMAMRRSKYRQ